MDVALQGVDALSVGDGGDECHPVDAGVGEVEGDAVGKAGVVAGQQPGGRLAAFAGADGGDAVVGDGAAVGQLQVELASCNAQHGVKECQRIACAGEGTHGEVARRIVDKRQLAVVDGGVVGGQPEA